MKAGDMKVKNRRLIRITAYVIIAAVLLWFPFKDGNYEIDMQGLKKEIASLADEKDMKKGVKADLRRFYHIPYDMVEDFVLYIPATAMGVEEIAVIKTSDKNADAVYSRIMERRDYQKKVFDGYGAAQCRLLDDAVIEKKGEYLIFICSSRSSEFMDAVERKVTG